MDMESVAFSTRLRFLLRHCGLDVKRFSPATHPEPVMRFLHEFAVGHVLDVGGNEGQFGSFLRAQGYRGEIVSFEPNPDAFQQLSVIAKRDSNWKIFNVGLGAKSEQAVLNVAEYSSYSSFLSSTSELTALDSRARVRVQTPVRIEKLDEVAAAHLTFSAPVLLKIDTQGFEKSVLAGAEKTLPKIKGVLLELSIKNLYVEQPLIEEMIPLMRSFGFALYSLSGGFIDRKTSEMIEADGLFVRARDSLCG
jgi:FkbM family methyltransferase